jgi:hypothetical protein
MLVGMHCSTMCDERWNTQSLSGGDIKANYTKGEHVSDDKSNSERLLHRVAIKKKCVEKAVTVRASDGPKLSYVQGCCQSCIN